MFSEELALKRIHNNAIKSEDPTEINQNLESTVKAKCTEDGWYFKKCGKQEGPFSLEDLADPVFFSRLAVELGVKEKEILRAKLLDYTRELSINELNEILTSTIKHDESPKDVTFFGMLLAQTEEDQYNIAFQAESSTGKSYIPLELVEYFPSNEKRVYAGASPTSFFHQMGCYVKLSEMANDPDIRALFDAGELADQKKHVILVDLENKILIFMDQPHWMLMERLRPLLSHDRKTLRYDITDKTGKGGLRTKTVIVKGYPSVLLATAKPTQDDQERTRMWLMSPEADQKKIIESLQLLGKKIGDREAFREWIQNHPARQWLKTRVSIIRDSGIRNIVIPHWEKVLERFIKKRPYLTPRSQRDFPRLLLLIKGIALLNCFRRSQPNRETIIAGESDIEAAFGLYESLASSNELGLSPETYRIYEEVIKPLCEIAEAVSRKDIIKQYWQVYHRPLADDRLRRQILPALESAGLIAQEVDPEDKRKMLVYCTVLSPISDAEGMKETDSIKLESRENRGKNSAPIRHVNKDSFDINTKSVNRKSRFPYSTISQPQQLLSREGQCAICRQNRPLQPDKFKEWYVCQKCYDKQPEPDR